MMIKPPAPHEIRAARAAAELTQTAAAALIYKSLNAWQYWEASPESKMHRTMDPAYFELFLIKTGLMPAPVIIRK